MAQNQNTGKSKRGFAAMSKEKQRRIAAMGGKASHGGGRGRNSSGSNAQRSTSAEEYGNE
ncbi:MAG TPA: KGG domain-containing protein [Candidatus Paceibacterota bacterium]|jgi:hypothetical protein|nr:KGG domain-containing protein [Candidatus Paceibacterota bacterium]